MSSIASRDGGEMAKPKEAGQEEERSVQVGVNVETSQAKRCDAAGSSGPYGAHARAPNPY
eukprot:6214639-Pleurochrysis_carterae.AAC.1